MKTQSDLKHQVKETIQELKALFEELELQVSLGKKEAKEVFDKEKHNFSEFVREQRRQWRRFGMMSEENLGKLEAQLHQLYTLLMADFPTDATAFQGWKDDKLRSIYELEYMLRDIVPGLNDTEKEMIQSLKMKLDVYRIHLAIADFGKVTELKPYNEDLRVQLDKTITFFENEVNDNWEKVEHFKEELGQSFTHLKKAFGELIGK